jgi:ubiquinone/menaquinone biosynthesis C-methylase UbiE
MPMLKKLIPSFLKRSFKDSVRGIVLSEETRDLVYFPSSSSETSYAIGPKPKQNGKFPIPPRNLQLNYGVDDESYLAGGAADVSTMYRLLGDSGFEVPRAKRVLELGCASGRMIRHMIDVAPAAELFGVDIDGQQIRWCIEHLSPPIQFCHTTIVPHLPFEDHYFDLVFAGSVFTHIEDIHETWLHELGRVIRPNGRLYISISDEHTIRLMDAYPPGDQYSSWLNSVPAYRDNKSNFGMIVVARGKDSQVFYHSDYFPAIVPKCFKWHSLTREAYAVRQSVVVLERI